MGEFKVHHVRFYQYNPSAIHCTAYDKTSQRLAVSRSNASIEIWSIPDNWYLEKTIVPRPGQSVEDLLWCQGRLFSASLHGNVQEYDLLRLRAKSHASSNAGAVWCLTTNEDNSLIAAGTEEGCVVFYKVTAEGVQYERASHRQEGRILSICWHTKENRIITGGIDAIRVWNASSGQAIQRLSVGRSENKKETIVWAVAVTNDFTIISGDSRGQTNFWNGRQGTLLKSYQCHKADVLSVAVTEDGESVFSSGVDASLVQFEYVAARQDSDWKAWVRSSVSHQHTHDVRTLTVTNKHIVSGGVDTQLICHVLHAEQGIKRWHRIAAIPTTEVVHAAHTANLVLLQYTDSLEVWRLGSTSSKSNVAGEVLPLLRDPLRLLQLHSKGQEHIVCSAISHCGQWLAYSDTSAIRLFQLSLEEADIGPPKLSLTRVRFLPPGTLAAHCLAFTPDGSTLTSATCEGTLQLLKMDAVKPQLLHTQLPPTGQAAGLHLLTVSPCGQYVATADQDNNVHVYQLDTVTKVTKTTKYLCSLPEYKFKPTALCFCPSKPTLAVAYTDQKIVEYNFTAQEYTAWSRELNKDWNVRWLKRQSKILRMLYHPTRHHELLLHDDQVLAIINQHQRPPTHSDVINLKRLNPGEEEKATEHAFHISTKFKYLLGLDVMKDDSLLVVERPPAAISESLPAVLRVKKFGT